MARRVIVAILIKQFISDKIFFLIPVLKVNEKRIIFKT